MSPSPTFDADPARLAQPFPADFAWGFAASAYQIEGAAAEDGRGPSIWDTFSRQPGAIADGSTGDVACDHYHRYPEDVRLMADLGARAYRFSISWSRVLPTGTGGVNQRGLDFYGRLVDELLGAGVQPLINLFHWDLPQALQDRGGFADPEVVGWFTDYAVLLASNLGDRVKDWMTFNEPAVFAFLGHADGIHAPGFRDWPTAIRVADNELRAHAMAAEAIRALVADAKVGVAIDVNQVAPATDSSAIGSPPTGGARPATRGSSIPSSAAATQRSDSRLIARRVTSTASSSPSRRPAISTTSDSTTTGATRSAPGRTAHSTGRSAPCLARSRRRWAGTSRPTACATCCSGFTRPTLRQRWWSPRTGPRTPIPSIPTAVVRDGGRLDYLARHVAAASEALAAGVPLTGYYVWSLLDNYEWSLGYSRRFGLVHVDFDSQRRTPKDSARWYQRLISRSRSSVSATSRR